MTRAHGIDISEFQVTFDPSKNPDDVQFVIIRASLGIFPDPKYKTFLDKIVSIPIRGAYHYFSSIRDWKKQADTFLDLVTDKEFHFYALDVEPPSAEHFPDIAKTYLSKKLADGARKWLEYVADRAGKQTLFYTNKDVYERLQGIGADWMDKWPLWIANYRGVDSRNLEPFLPRGVPERQWKIWQYSADNPPNYKGDAYGVGSKHIDLDVYNGTAQEMRQWLGIAVQKEFDRTSKKKNSAPTWQEVRAAVKAVARENNARWSEWLHRAGVNYDRALRDKPYSGPPIDLWPIEAQFRTEIMKRLGIDLAAPDDEGGHPGYTWGDVRAITKAVARENNAQWSKWFHRAGVNYDRALRDKPYSGPPIDQWQIESQYREEIRRRLKQVASSGEATPIRPLKPGETMANGQIKLNVPYISQQDPKIARLKTKDCGPTCLAMIINAIEPARQMTVDYLYDTHLPEKVDKYTNWVQLRQISKKEGFPTDFASYNSRELALEALKKFIRDGQPVIVLVNYAILTQSKKQFAHFAVVTGIDENRVFIHDPYLPATPESPGKFNDYPTARFLDGWGGLNKLPPGKGKENLNFSRLVFTNKEISRLAG